MGVGEEEEARGAGEGVGGVSDHQASWRSRSLTQVACEGWVWMVGGRGLHRTEAGEGEK